MFSHLKVPISKIVLKKKNQNNSFTYEESQNSLIQITKNNIQTTGTIKHQKRKSLCNLKCRKFSISTFQKEHESLQLKLDNKSYSTTRLNNSNLNAVRVPENTPLKKQRNISAVQNKACINHNSNLLNNKIDCLNHQNTHVSNPTISKYKELDYTNYYNQLQISKIKHLQNVQIQKKNKINDFSHTELSRQFRNKAYLNSLNEKTNIFIQNNSSLELNPKRNELKTSGYKLNGLRKSSSQINRIKNIDKIYMKIKKDKNDNSCYNKKSESQFPSGPEDIHIKFVKLRQDSKIFYQIMETHVQSELINGNRFMKNNFQIRKETETEKNYPDIEFFNPN